MQQRKSQENVFMLGGENDWYVSGGTEVKRAISAIYLLLLNRIDKLVRGMLLAFF